MVIQINTVRRPLRSLFIQPFWIPIYDKSDLPGFYMAVGSSGNQYKNAPVVGNMMAGLIDFCEKGRDHDKDPSREIQVKTSHGR
jgi:hypothetical protein